MADFDELLAEAAAHWPLQQTTGSVATDVAEGRNGSLQGGLNFGSHSVEGPRTWLARGLRFDGFNDYVSIPSQVALGLGSSHSYSFWWKSYANAPWSPQVLVETGGINQGSLVHLEGSSLYAIGVRSDVRSSVVVPLGPEEVWRHCVFVHESQLLRVYIDGALAASMAPTATWVQAGNDNGALGAANNARWFSGSVSGSVAAFLNGALAGVAIYRRALTAAEIGSLYSGPKPVLVQPPQFAGAIAGRESVVTPAIWDGRGNGSLSAVTHFESSADGLNGWSVVPGTAGVASWRVPLALLGRYVRLVSIAQNAAADAATATSPSSLVTPGGGPGSLVAGKARSGGLVTGVVSPAGALVAGAVHPQGA